MKTTFKSKIELVRYYSDEENCKALLAQQRWGDKPACPHCGNAEKIYVTNRGYKCSAKECHKKFTVITGTIFENTKIKLNLWFEAIFVITAHKKGISSHQLAKDIGCSQKTAWFILHRVREMLKNKSLTPFSGVVQIDETYVGAPEYNKHADKRTAKTQGRSTKTKTPVLGILETGGNIIAKKVEDAKGKSLLPVMLTHVAPGATVHTDELPTYRALRKFKYDHQFVRHGVGEYVSNGVHVNGCENFWSLLKRGIVGIYHHVSPKHLDRYCDEFAYRFNTRKTTDVERFNNVLANSDGRLKWNDLTHKSK